MKISKTALATFAGVATIAVLSFNNCSPVNFETATEASKSVGKKNLDDGGQPSDTATPTPPPSIDDPTPSPTATPAPTPPTVAIQNCQTAASKGSLKSATQEIIFDDTKAESGRNEVCVFNSGDNLSMRDTYLRARYEQKRTLNLPAGAVLCGIEMTTDVQRMKYDDVFFITFNGYVIASNLRSAVEKSRAEPIMVGSTGVLAYTYDWLKHRDSRFSGYIENGQGDYCLGQGEGKSTCQWPPTEQTGNMTFDFAPELLITLGLKSDSQNQTFGFITTGDNDPAIDCYHQRLALKMKTYYYLPQ